MICVIGAVSCFLLFFLTSILSRIKKPWAKFIPVPLVVTFLAGLTAWFLGLEENTSFTYPAICLNMAVRRQIILDTERRKIRWCSGSRGLMLRGRSFHVQLLS